jgi:hypothetical protein
MKKFWALCEWSGSSLEFFMYDGCVSQLGSVDKVFENLVEDMKNISTKNILKHKNS